MKIFDNAISVFFSLLVFASQTLYYEGVSDNISGIMTVQWYYLVIEVIKPKKYLLNKSLQLFSIERNPEFTKMGLKLSLSFAKNAQQTFLPFQADIFFFSFPEVEDLQAKVKAQKASAVTDTFIEYSKFNC